MKIKLKKPLNPSSTRLPYDLSIQTRIFFKLQVFFKTRSDLLKFWVFGVWIFGVSLYNHFPLSMKEKSETVNRCLPNSKLLNYKFIIQSKIIN